jgi:hypothetical protein
LFAERPVEKLLHKLQALELQKLRVLFRAPVKGHAQLSGPGEHLGIFNNGFVSKRVGVNGVYRSMTCNASLWKFPARPNQAWSLKLVTSTTCLNLHSSRPIVEFIQLFFPAYISGDPKSRNGLNGEFSNAGGRRAVY